MAARQAHGGGGLRGSIIVALMRILTMAAGFAVNVVLARLLPLDQLGVYFLLASLVQVGSMAALGGLNNSAIPLVAGAMATDTPERVRPILRATGLTLVVSTTLTALGLVLFFEHIMALLGVAGLGSILLALTLIWLLALALCMGSAHILRAFGQMAQIEDALKDAPCDLIRKACQSLAETAKFPPNKAQVKEAALASTNSSEPVLREHESLSQLTWIPCATIARSARSSTR